MLSVGSATRRLTGVARRARLFARDYFNEFGIAWSLARMRDCERNSGHRWGPVSADDLFGLSRTCARCGTAESVKETHSTGSTTTPTAPPSSGLL